MPLFTDQIAGQVIGPGGPFIEDLPVLFFGWAQKLLQFPVCGPGTEGGPALCIGLCHRIAGSVVGPGRLQYAVRSGHAGQAVFLIIGIRPAGTIILLLVIGLRHHMADPVPCCVIEHPLTAAVRVMDPDVVAVAVIVVDNPFSIVQIPIICIGMNFFQNFSFSIQHLPLMAAVRVLCID